MIFIYFYRCWSGNHAERPSMAEVTRIMTRLSEVSRSYFIYSGRHLISSFGFLYFQLSTLNPLNKKIHKFYLIMMAKCKRSDAATSDMQKKSCEKLKVFNLIKEKIAYRGC